MRIAEPGELDSEKLFAVIFDNAADGILAANPETKKFYYANKKICQMLGYSAGELKSLGVQDIHAAGDLPYVTEQFEKLVRGEIIVTEDIRVQRKDGSIFYAGISGHVITISEKAYLIGIFRDITERKRVQEKEKKLAVAAAEERIECKKRTELEKAYKELEKSNQELKDTMAQLIQNEKMTALGELTAGIAHEMKQPLNVINIVCQSILKDIQRGQYKKEDIENDLPEILGQIKKITGIIDHMRVFTRRTEGLPHEMVDINSVINNVFKFLEQEIKDRNIEVIKKLAPDLPKCTGDPIRLEQVFLNLITNARNAVESCQKENKRIEIRTYKIEGQPALAVEVEDNGHGIPENLMGKIFQPFFTTREPGKGTGLGLSVAGKIIEEHRGKIEVRSKAGEGAIFRVILPITD